MSLIKKSIIIVMLITAWVQLNAQDTINNSKTRVFHLSFITPLGTNGMQSCETTNNYSLNIIAGCSGGLNGIEIGSLYNMLKGNMTGVQISGFGNTVLGTTKGVQVTGFANLNKQSVIGLQLSGFTNIVLDSTKGVQITGFANIVTENVTGLQLSGFTNIALDSTKGTQITGFANVVTENVKGFQLSGFANINTKKTEGVQVSGFINYTKQLKGVQLSFINIVADTVENGIPIGVFSFVKKGYFNLELTGGESLHGNLNYKMGVEKFYTIYKLGYSSFENKPIYSYGLGFGSLISLSENHKIAIDASCNNINYINWSSDLNLLNKLDINYNLKLANNISIIVGPSINVYTTNNEVNNEFGTLNIPYTIYEYENSSSKLSVWIGLNAGLSITI